MAVRSKHPQDVAKWIFKCIDSMDSCEQFKAMYKLTCLYRTGYRPISTKSLEHSYAHIELVYKMQSALFDKIKTLNEM